MELIDKVYRFISLRPRSEKELKVYLHGKHTSLQDSEKIFTLLKKQGLINDSAFVDWWLEQRATFRPRGKRALMVELRQKGISQDLIEEALSKNLDELTLAQKALQRKLKLYDRLPDREKKAKLSAYLNRNGFSWETIKKALEEDFKK